MPQICIVKYTTAASIAARMSRSAATATNRAPTGASSWPASDAESASSDAIGAGATAGRSHLSKSSAPVRPPAVLRRATSGVARRTASGCRGGAGLVMRGRSSGIGMPNSGSSSDAGPSEEWRASGRRTRIDAGPSSRTPRPGRADIASSRNDRSSSGRGASALAGVFSGSSNPSGVDDNENSYPQLRQRST